MVLVAIMLCYERVPATLARIYLARKAEAAAACGVAVHQVVLPATTPEEVLVARVEEANRAEEVDGVIVQLPLPPHIDEAR